MAILRFEDVIAWQKAQDLAVDIYSSFGDSRDYGFKDQICRQLYLYQIILQRNLTEVPTKNLQNFYPTQVHHAVKCALCFTWLPG